MNRHEFEIDEQRQDFRRKREELVKKFDFELQTMEQKQKIEIERESVLLTNEYNKKMKQIRFGEESISLHLDFSKKGFRSYEYFSLQIKKKN